MLHFCMKVLSVLRPFLENKSENMAFSLISQGTLCVFIFILAFAKWSLSYILLNLGEQQPSLKFCHAGGFLMQV